MFERLSQVGATPGVDVNAICCAVVEILAEQFGVPIARVDEISGQGILCRACYDRGQIFSERRESLQGTPAEVILREKRSYLTVRSQEEFPGDEYLRQRGIRVYVCRSTGV